MAKPIQTDPTAHDRACAAVAVTGPDYCMIVIRPTSKCRQCDTLVLIRHVNALCSTVGPRVGKGSSPGRTMPTDGVLWTGRHAQVHGSSPVHNSFCIPHSTIQDAPCYWVETLKATLRTSSKPFDGHRSLHDGRAQHFVLQPVRAFCHHGRACVGVTELATMS